MNPIAEEIKSYYGSGKMDHEEFIKHYGVGHLDGGHSGRWPWGSGEDPYQSEGGRPNDFLSKIEALRKKGWKETPKNIEKEFGMNTSWLKLP